MDSYSEFLLDVNDRITIGDDTVLTLVKAYGSIAKIGIEGPLNVYRGELKDDGLETAPSPEAQDLGTAGST